MLIHLADANQQTLIDYREKAPIAATETMYLNPAGDVDRQREFFSLQSAGVPGTVAGLLYAQEKYGLLSRRGGTGARYRAGSRRYRHIVRAAL